MKYFCYFVYEHSDAHAHKQQQQHPRRWEEEEKKRFHCQTIFPLSNLHRHRQRQTHRVHAEMAENLFSQTANCKWMEKAYCKIVQNSQYRDREKSHWKTKTKQTTSMDFSFFRCCFFFFCLASKLKSSIWRRTVLLLSQIRIIYRNDGFDTIKSIRCNCSWICTTQNWPFVLVSSLAILSSLFLYWFFCLFQPQSLFLLVIVQHVTIGDNSPFFRIRHLCTVVFVLFSVFFFFHLRFVQIFAFTSVIMAMMNRHKVKVGKKKGLI